MDLLMPGLDGVAATERLRASATGARVLILTTYADDERVWERSRDGATTPHELDVLRLIARGLGNKQIAAQLNLSLGTVKRYVSTILPKIRAGDRTQTALFAVKHGLEAVAK